jgi:putative intracellular protease/amidase/acetyl esterase/lipase
MPPSLRGIGGPILRALPWILAFLLPPLLVGTRNVRSTAEARLEPPPAPPSGALPSVSLPDPERPMAVILVGDGFTEATDLLAPYELLARSGAYQVRTLARERKPLALFPGRLDILPHLTLQEWEEGVGQDPDLIVLPYMEGGSPEAHGELEEWLRRRWTGTNTLVTICGGSWVAAAAGLLEGRSATSHRNVLRVVEDAHREVAWTRGVRYVDDGNLVSSAGITSGIDAVLHFLAREHGEETARRVAREVGYPHLEYLEDPAFELLRTNASIRLLNRAFGSGPRVGLLLADGASELHLAALTDTYPRSFIASLLPIAVDRRYVATRHGLHLVPRWEIGDPPALDRLILAGNPTPMEGERGEGWIRSLELAPEPLETGGFPYDRFLEAMARDLGGAAARDAALGLEYPMSTAEIGAGLPAPRALAAGLLLGLLGVGAAFLLRQGVRGLRSPGGSRSGPGVIPAVLLAAVAAVAGAASPPPAEAEPFFPATASSPEAPAPETPDRRSEGAPFRVQVVQVEARGAVLAGRLLLPAGEAPRPAVLLLAGARDSRNLPGLAEYLAGRGLVVLDLEKRGVGGSSGSWKGETFAQRTEDALAAVRFLEDHAPVDPHRIGVVGHSQGGYIASMLAARTHALAFVVLLAGPGETVRDQVLTHRRIALEREGLSQEAVEKELRGLERQLGLATHLRPVCRGLRLSYLCGMIHHDPIPLLEELQAPTLALFTAFDDMVPPEPNARLVRDALARGGNGDATVHVFSEGCHDFMPWDGPGAPMLSGCLSGVTEMVGDWIEARAAAEAVPAPMRGRLPQTWEEEASAIQERKRLLLPLPVVYRMPETGWAGGAAVMRVAWSEPTPSGHALPFTDELSVVYTEKRQFMAGLGTDRHLDGGRFHVFGSVSTSHFPAHFHGIGRDRPPDRFEAYTARTASFHGGIRRELRPGLRAGGGIQLTRHGVRDLLPEGLLDSGTIIGSTGGTVASLTLAAGVDTRDRVTAPHRGSWAELRLRGAERGLVGDFAFSQVTLDGRSYLSLGGEHILALQLFASTTQGDVPFQELPTMGGSAFMRGYHPNQHRDRSAVGGQVEYRTPHWWRLGAVGFVGGGAVGTGWTEIRPDHLRFSGGGGLRFALDRTQRLNLRADLGVGRGSPVLYLGIREAF